MLGNLNHKCGKLTTENSYNADFYTGANHVVQSTLVSHGE